MNIYAATAPAIVFIIALISTAFADTPEKQLSDLVIQYTNLSTNDFRLERRTDKETSLYQSSRTKSCVLTRSTTTSNSITRTPNDLHPDAFEFVFPVDTIHVNVDGGLMLFEMTNFPELVDIYDRHILLLQFDIMFNNVGFMDYYGDLFPENSTYLLALFELEQGRSFRLTPDLIWTDVIDSHQFISDNRVNRCCYNDNLKHFIVLKSLFDALTTAVSNHGDHGYIPEDTGGYSNYIEYTHTLMRGAQHAPPAGRGEAPRP